jgi:hypothetical protein
MHPNLTEQSVMYSVNTNNFTLIFKISESNFHVYHWFPSTAKYHQIKIKKVKTSNLHEIRVETGYHPKVYLQVQTVFVLLLSKKNN